MVTSRLSAKGGSLRRIFGGCLLFLIFIASPVLAADCSDDPTSDLFKKFGPCPGGLAEIEGIVGNVISVIVGLGVIAMLMMLIMAGVKYLTSGGEPKAIQAAHNTAAFAFMGILFMIGAWIALQLIAGFTGIQVTSFDIKKLCGVGGVEFCK